MKTIDPKSAIGQRVNQLRGYQENLFAEQRLEIWELLQDGYCKHCGEKPTDSPCQCMNDE